MMPTLMLSCATAAGAHGAASATEPTTRASRRAKWKEAFFMLSPGLLLEGSARRGDDSDGKQGVESHRIVHQRSAVGLMHHATSIEDERARHHRQRQPSVLF